MKSIGYIVSKHKIKDVLNGITFVNSYTDVPKGMPYLIVGLNEAKKNIPNFTISKRDIDNLGSWTFGKTEQRNEYEKDINKFYHKIINNLINNIRYYYINILTISYNKFKKLYNIVNSNEAKYIYISNDMIYIYVNNYILGISIKMIKYCGISEKKILAFLERNKNNIIIKNDSFVSFKFKSMIKNKKYLLSYFMSLQ